MKILIDLPIGVRCFWAKHRSVHLGPVSYLCNVAMEKFGEGAQ